MPFIYDETEIEWPETMTITSRRRPALGVKPPPSRTAGMAALTRPAATPRRRANFQKSGLSACGTAEFLPEYLEFSAQTYSPAPPPRPSPIGGRP